VFRNIVNDFKKRLIETVQIIFDLKFDLQTFTDWELETAEELYTEKYSRLKYIFPDYHAEERKD
jgi:lipoate-protein ligase A